MHVPTLCTAPGLTFIVPTTAADDDVPAPAQTIQTGAATWLTGLFSATSKHQSHQIERVPKATS